MTTTDTNPIAEAKAKAPMTFTIDAPVIKALKIMASDDATRVVLRGAQIYTAPNRENNTKYDWAIVATDSYRMLVLHNTASTKLPELLREGNSFAHVPGEWLHMKDVEVITMDYCSTDSNGRQGVRNVGRLVTKAGAMTPTPVDTAAFPNVAQLWPRIPTPTNGNPALHRGADALEPMVVPAAFNARYLGDMADVTVALAGPKPKARGKGAYNRYDSEVAKWSSRCAAWSLVYQETALKPAIWRATFGCGHTLLPYDETLLASMVLQAHCLLMPVREA